jgi:hypothetical protein
MAKAPKQKAPENMAPEEIEAELAKGKARLGALEKHLWKGKLVKLVNANGDVKVQDNPERVEQLKGMGWKVEAEAAE